MRKYLNWSIFLLFLLQLGACSSFYQPGSVQYKDYRIKQNQPASEALNSLLKPYADSVNKSMSDLIAVAAISLEKKQPEGTLNNIMADAMLNMAREKYNTAVQAAFVNYGGIRLPSLPAGNITRGKVFELSPFDNIVVLLKIKGDTLQQFLDHIAERGGWPCAGISFQVKNKKAVNILIGGAPVDLNNYYTIATLDYVANGGDDCAMLKPIPQKNNGFLFRDALLEYFSSINKQGKKITASIENRVTNAE